MHADLKENVAQGALKCDEMMPGWHRKINTATLDITSCTHCICGQLTGSYFTGLTMFGIAPGQSGSYGFSASGGSSREVLKEAWKEEIAARLLNDKFVVSFVGVPSKPEMVGV